jgi:[ribosomal protein S5]-alanine N-acetyltransferase
MKTRIYIRQPLLPDELEFLRATRQSRWLHQPWTNPPGTTKEFQAWLERMKLPANSAYLVCRRATHEIVGVININDILLGKFCIGYLGYYVFAGFERQGLMREGLQAVIKDAFKTLKLHRLEANIQPDNKASIALVSSCGLTKEGYSPGYLKIAGRRRDHERWAIVAG